MRHSFNGNYPVTRPYGVVDPAYANYPGSKHPGTDYGLPANTPLVAGIGGVVVTYIRGSSKVGRGNEVVITSGNKQRKTCHMNAVYVQMGQQIKEGDPIGLSGYTGYVVDAQGNVGTPGGAHLHDELLIDGQYVDLEKYLKEGGDMSRLDPTDEEWDELHQVYTGDPAPKGGNPHKDLSETINLLKNLPASKEHKRRAEAFQFLVEEIGKRDGGIELLRKEINRIEQINPDAANKLQQIKSIVEG